LRPRSIKFRTKANQDLLEIFQYSLEAFGEAQAAHYVSDVLKRINNLSLFPMIGVQSKKSSLRILPEQSHVIVYEVYPKHLAILRVLYAKAIKTKL